MNLENDVRTRDEILEKDKWKLEDMYCDDAAWEADYQKITSLAEAFYGCKGTMENSSAALYEVLKKQDELNCSLESVYVYANQKYHEDTANGVYQQMAGKAQRVLTLVGDVTSFVEPELLSIPEEKLMEYLEENKELQLYKRYILEKLKDKKHILSEEMEAVLAKVSEIAKGPENIFSMFNNADVDFGKITDAEGRLVSLTHGSYVSFLESADVRVRKEAFQAMYAQYEKNRNTLAATMNAHVQQDVFYANMRKYHTSMEYALDNYRIPVTVYEKLIEAVHEHMDTMHHYVGLRKKLLDAKELHMYDMYVPVVKKPEKTYTFEEAKATVKEGLAVLGEEYTGILEEGFTNGWIDVYESKGKRSGAYSWGAYGTHPYVLLNYNGTLNHVFTLAHEMGHAIHSYYSDKTQEYPYAGYGIFVAEVASTCNEALLIHYLMEHAQDKQEKMYLVNYFLDQFKSTLYRQTMFAEFEKKTHEIIEAGETLTADTLCSVYKELVALYHGDEIVVDDEIAMEWARIPHFYNSFYVYQYATGFSAAIAISQKILNKEPGILDKYKQFLSGGSSKDCLDLLRICDVDMESPKPVEDALEVFAKSVAQLEEMIYN
jgi:oligoendopeptidase F